MRQQRGPGREEAPRVGHGLDEIERALGTLRSGGTFAVGRTTAAEALRIDVTGVGPLRFPISEKQARALIAVARPAPFGRGAETLHDPAVRATWQVARSRVKVDARAFRSLADAELEWIRAGLGLPEGGRLRAVLDKLLIYEAGHFFLPHQDSERGDAMVGSLSILLPCRQAGGELVVTHQGEAKTFRPPRAGRPQLSWVGFYSDCRHDVRPVRSGFRIALTHHLLYEGARARKSRLAHGRSEALCELVRSYFATAATTGWSDAAPRPPERLVVLLDHEYSAKSLAWERLKNADRVRVEALSEVAERLECERFLALADVHETWGCEEDDWGCEEDDWGCEEDDREDGGSGFRGRDDWDDSSSEESGRDEGDPVLVDLQDSEIELRHWVGAKGERSPGVSSAVTECETCCTRPSREMEPYHSEHEGYMGNYGNTVDRWYHRAAFVMWPREQGFVLRARHSPAWAVGEIGKLARRGGAGKDLRNQVARLLPVWGRCSADEEGAAFFTKVWELAHSVADAELALGLLAPFGPERINRSSMPALLRLVDAHGAGWAKRLFTGWQRPRHDDDRGGLTHLPPLAAALHAHGTRPSLALVGWVLERELARAAEQVRAEMERGARWPTLEFSKGLVHDLASLFAASAEGRSRGTTAALVALIRTTGLPLPVLGAVLRRLKGKGRAGETRLASLGRLYEHLVRGLDAFLAAPDRASTDWSLETAGGCACSDCSVLNDFLRDPARVQLLWPMAKERRGHIHGIIEGGRLPVRHETIRQGRPQTLRLEKQPQLFALWAAHRRRHEEFRAWLLANRSALTRSR